MRACADFGLYRLSHSDMGKTWELGTRSDADARAWLKARTRHFANLSKGK